MMKTGIFLNIISVFVTTVIFFAIGLPIFGIELGVLPKEYT